MNKSHLMMNRFRAAVKSLPKKNMADAFDVKGVEYGNVNFVLSTETEHEKDGVKGHKLMFVADNEDFTQATGGTISLFFTDEQYEHIKTMETVSFSKEVYVNHITLCPALQTIITILGKPLFDSKEIYLKDNEVFGVEMSQFQHKTVDDCKAELGKNLEFMVKNFKKI